MSLGPSPRSQRAARRNNKRKPKSNAASNTKLHYHNLSLPASRHNKSNMANGLPSKAFEPTYSETRARFCFNYQRVTSDQTRADSIRHSPLVSLAVKYAVDNPAPKPSDSSKDTSAANNSSSGTLSSGNNLFGGTPAPALASQQLQITAAPTAPSLSSPAATFGKPNLSFAPFSQYGTTTLNPSPSDAPKVAQTGGLFGQAPNAQHERQAPSQSAPTPSGSEPKVPKLKAESSPTNGRIATNGPSSDVPLFGQTANGSTTQSFSFASPQLNLAANFATRLNPSASIFPNSDFEPSVRAATENLPSSQTYLQSPIRPQQSPSRSTRT
jgi:hypothetical protein